MSIEDKQFYSSIPEVILTQHLFEEELFQKKIRKDIEDRKAIKGHKVTEEEEADNYTEERKIISKTAHKRKKDILINSRTKHSQANYIF
jgi:hypothetical protein